MQDMLTNLSENSKSCKYELINKFSKSLKVNHWLVAAFCILVASFNLSAYEKGISINLGFKTVIKSKILKEDRELWIRLPVNYDDNKKYPVLYLLDGRNSFTHTIGILGSLELGEVVPELIVVGITNTNRLRDLTPTKNENLKSSGGGENFLDFIELELIPQINKEYRTENYKIFSGHSFGGLLVMHAFHSRPNLFQAHFAFSPSLYWNNKETAKKTIDFLANTKQFSNYLYLNIGNEGLLSDNHKGLAMRTAFQEIETNLQKSKPENFLYKIDFFENEKHQTTPVIGQFHAFRHLYEPWYIPLQPLENGLTAVKQYYQMLSDRYGYEIKPYKNIIDEAGYYQLTTKNDTSEAVAFFKDNISNFPTCASCYNSLADAYEKAGEIDKAIEKMELALEYSHESAPQFSKYKQKLLELHNAP